MGGRRKYRPLIWMAHYGDKKPVDKVSTNFYVSEVEYSETAVRLEILNKAPEWVLENARLTAHHLNEPIRDQFGAYRPQSWYRGEELEKAITWEKGFRRWCAKRALPWITRPKLYKNMGAQTSWDRYFERKSHPRGQAVDAEIAGVDNDVLFFWIRDNLEFDQLIREFPKPGDPMSGWVHWSWSKDVNRRQAFSIPTYDRYL